MRVIVDIKGGLGNQLFCYATGYALAREHKAKLYLDTSMYAINNVKDRKYELENYSLEHDGLINYKYSKNVLIRKLGINKFRKIISVGLGTRVYNERLAYKYDIDLLSINHNVYLDGFWQTEKYFKKYQHELIDILTPIREISLSARTLLTKIRDTESVSIHVRHGDYINLGWNLDMSYYDKAIEKMISDDIIKTFIVFSDDMEYCKSYFSKYENQLNFVFAEYESDNPVIDDMYLMSKCKHNIAANSSYSWWGAWLNKNTEKTVICPRIDVWDGDFYPEEWVKIDMKEDRNCAAEN